MRKSIRLLNADGSSDIVIGTGGAYSVLLSASGWSRQEDGSYTQTATIQGVSNTDRAVIDINLSTATTSTYATLQEAWLLVGRAYTVADGITFVCYEGAPGADISVNVEVL